MQTANETILLVEDEESVRTLLGMTLRTAGYTVVEAANAAAALSAIATFAGEIHLLVTDVVMPGMRGDALAAQLRERFPGVPVIYMSGYPDGVLDPEMVSGENTGFIQKPASLASVLSLVREVLARRGGRPPDVDS